MDRIRISQIGQAARTLQGALVAREEAALIERQIRAASAASQAESVTSATAHIERASPRIARLLIQAQVAARSREIAIPLEAIPSETTACVIRATRVALPGLLLLFLHNGPDIVLDSRTSSSKSAPAAYSTAIALNAAGLSVGRRVLFLFFHFYDLILKGRKCASFNGRTAQQTYGGWDLIFAKLFKSRHLRLDLGTDMIPAWSAISQMNIYRLEYRSVCHRGN